MCLDVPDEYHFLPLSIKRGNPLSSGTAYICTFELFVGQFNNHDVEILSSGVFTLTFRDPASKSNRYDRHVQERSFTCFSLDEEYCEKANKTQPVSVECK